MQSVVFRCFHANFHNTSWTRAQMHGYFVHRQVKTSDRSRVTYGFTLESASASLTSLPGTYLMLTSYCCMRRSIYTCQPGWGQRRDVWTQAVYGPYALPRAVHRRIGGIAQVQTRCNMLCTRSNCVAKENDPLTIRVRWTIKVFYYINDPQNKYVISKIDLT